MQARRRYAWPLVSVLALAAAGSMALAQQQPPRTWTDPPAQIPPPPAAEPAPPTTPAPVPTVEAPPPAPTPPVRSAEPPAQPRLREAAPAARTREADREADQAPPAAPPRTREADQAPPARTREAAPSERKPLARPRTAEPIETTPPVRPRAAEPVEPAPPIRQAQPRRVPASGRLAQERAAESLAIGYLQAWSTPNSAALDLTRDFYGSRVLFHGRVLSTGALFEEKRRFARRWPERSYRTYPETVQTDCSGPRDLCTVRAGFDFMAQNPDSGRRSAGRGTLQLIVSFAGDKPMIVGENSWIGRTDRETVSLDALDD